MRLALHRVAICALMLVCYEALADKVHVYQRTSAGGEIKQLSDAMLDTGSTYTTVTAPSIAGYIFTHWSIDRNQEFKNRDAWGRAFDATPYLLLEQMTLTANYLPVTQDQDGDGVADGYEIYWYGDLSKNAASDTDADGFTFIQELANELNPLFPDEPQLGEVLNLSSAALLYNPHGYAPYVIRSEPEGTLFATIREYARPGDVISTASYSPTSSKFAYWTVNDERSQDAWGVSLNSVTFTASDKYITECVAHCVSNETERMSYYWYGDAEHGEESDSDGDGFTFVRELANGTNPVMPDEYANEGILNFDSGIVQYNPFGYVAYIIRSEPEGVLFATESDYKAPGTALTTPSLSPSTSAFAYWTKNGERQQDAWGVALNAVPFTAQKEDMELIAYAESDGDRRQSLYWYGDVEHTMTSDTDGDGYTFAEELANDTSPVFPDEVENEEVLNFDSGLLEVNAQPYEQVRGAIIGGSFAEMFDSPIAGNQAASQTFGTNLVPYVFDLNGDGLFDIVLVSSSGIRIYRNVGGIGNPEFVEDNGLSTAGADFGSTDMSRIAAWNLNTQPTLAVTWVVGDVDLDGFPDLLVSDEVGHIWYYRNVSAAKELTQATFVLQHKVWAGTYDGFASRLAIAVVDWESDGDLDCLAGTAEGKLMLLRNPKVGRPTNVRALSGIDNVLLTWDPNAQSRIRGYKVYRSAADANAYQNITVPYTPLPTYRDYSSQTGDFDYKVSSVSRHYVAGDSTPIINESPATEALRASIGKVSLHWNDVVAKRGETFSLMLSIDNSANLSPEGMVIEIEYDHTVLNLLKTLPSGLFEQSKIAPGSGKLYEYVFEIVDGEQGAVETSVSVKGATMYGIGGAVVGVALPEKNAVVKIASGSSAPYQLGDLNGDGKVDTLDLRELAKLKSVAGRKWTANQLKAGDFNGNGKLDEADYQALRDLLKEKGLL